MLLKILQKIFFFIILPLTSQPLKGMAGQTSWIGDMSDADGVGQVSKKGRLLNVTVCDLKLRNFESVHSGNATEASA